MRIRILSGSLALLLFGMAASARPVAAEGGTSAAEDEERARAHFRLGRAHYDNGDFPQAAVEFEEAYRISQRAALLYNIYLAYRDANDTRSAAEALRKYLALEKNIENRGQLESKLAALDHSLAENPQPSAAPAGKPAATAAAPAPQRTPAAEAAAPQPAPAAALQPTAAKAADKPFPVLPVVLMGTGGAMIAGSVVTGLMAAGKHNKWETEKDACERANSCDEYSPERAAELNALKSSGQTLAIVTDVLLFGGIAAAGTGVALFFLDSGTESPRASVSCGIGTCRLSGTF